MLDDLKITCDDCGRTVRYSLQDVARHRTVRCSCGCEFEFEDSGGGAARAAKAARDLDKALDGLSRTIRF